MDESTIRRLSADIEDLKRAVKRNDPLLHAVAAPPGWAAFSVAAGVTVTLFALPAHFLVARYGSFGAIPALPRAALWAVLGVFVVAGGILKVLLMTRRAYELEGHGGLWKTIRLFYAGRDAHITAPLTAGMIAGVAFAVAAGRPWLALPTTTFLFGVLANVIANRSGLSSYYVVGYWGITLGLASLCFVEAAPFLWLFVMYGGMFFAFAAAQRAAFRRDVSRRGAAPFEADADEPDKTR